MRRSTERSCDLEDFAGLESHASDLYGLIHDYHLETPQVCHLPFQHWLLWVSYQYVGGIVRYAWARDMRMEFVEMLPFIPSFLSRIEPHLSSSLGFFSGGRYFRDCREESLTWRWCVTIQLFVSTSDGHWMERPYWDQLHFSIIDIIPPSSIKHCHCVNVLLLTIRPGVNGLGA